MKSYLDHAKDIIHSAENSFIGKVALNFIRNANTDQAASLTYYMVFSFVPLILAGVSLLGILGLSQYLLDHLLPALKSNLSPATYSIIQEPLLNFRDFGGIGITFAIGIISMAWSASNYLSAFGRAMDRIQNTREKDAQNSILVRLRMLLLTLVILLFLVVGTGFFVVSDGLIEFITVFDFGEHKEFILKLLYYLNELKFPVIIFFLICTIALLYFATPSDFNLKKRIKKRSFFPGAALALSLIIATSIGFNFFVSHFGKYDAVYGTLAGVIVTLLLFWIINCMLLLGAELNQQLDVKRGLGREKAPEEPAVPNK